MHDSVSPGACALDLLAVHRRDSLSMLVCAGSVSGHAHRHQLSPRGMGAWCPRGRRHPPSACLSSLPCSPLLPRNLQPRKDPGMRSERVRKEPEPGSFREEEVAGRWWIWGPRGCLHQRRRQRRRQRQQLSNLWRFRFNKRGASTPLWVS